MSQTTSAAQEPDHSRGEPNGTMASPETSPTPALLSRRTLLLSASSMTVAGTVAPARAKAKAAKPAASYFPPPDNKGGWRTLTDAVRRAGVDKTRLEQAWAFTERCSANVGLCVVRNGYLVLERYAGRAQRNVNPDIASTGKAFTSIACGVMLREFKNKIPEGLNQKVFMPAYLPEAFPLSDPRKADITLGHLLCMTAGYHGEGSAPGVVDGNVVPLAPPGGGQNSRDLDGSSLNTPLWTNPGGGYSYSSPSPHVASIVLRHVAGMELQDYIQMRLAAPMGWGPWAYCLHRNIDGVDTVLPHANGAGSTALHSTDALRFGYCLLRNGMWNTQSLVPADYIQMCHTPLPQFNRHAPFSLMFEHNADGHIAGAPRDAFFKSGAGGFCLYVVPSLDLVIYKMGGGNNQYDPTLTGLPQPAPNTSRDDWKPIPATPFSDGSQNGEAALRRVLEMVCASVVDTV